MVKSIISLLLSVITVFSTVSISLEQIKKQDNEAGAYTEGMSVQANTDLSKMIDGKMNENNDASSYECNIADVVVSGESATVSVNANIDGSVIVEIADENSGNIITSGEKSFKKDDTLVKVDLDSAVPENYVINAEIVDEADSQQSSTYTSTNNTTWYKNFSDLQTDDFDNNLVLNLDDSTKNNFIVFDEDINFVSKKTDLTELKQIDEDTVKYQLSVTEETKNLKNGDVFCYNKDNIEEMILGKVSDVDENNGYYTIIADEPSMEDAFSVIKISYDDSQCAMEPVSKMQGNTYNDFLNDNCIQKNSLECTNLNDVEINSLSNEFESGASSSMSGSKKLSFGLNFTPEIKGSLSLEMGASVSIEWISTKKYFSTSFKLTPKISYSIKFEAKLKRTKNFGEFKIPTLVPGLYVGVNIGVRFEVSGSVSVSLSMSQVIGASWSTTGGVKNLSTKPSVQPSLNIKGTVKVGVVFEPNASLAKVAEVGFSTFSGVQAECKQEFCNENNGDRHDCKFCLAGSVDAVGSLSLYIKLDLIIWTKKVEYTLSDEKKLNLFKFYNSVDYVDQGFGSCPHHSYRTTVKVVDENNNPIAGAKVDGNSTSNGIVKIWYTKGKHSIVVSSAGYQTKKLTIGAKEVKTYVVKLKKGLSSTVDYEIDPSVAAYDREMSAGSSGYGYSTYVAPLTYTEPVEGIILSTSLAGQRRSDVAWVQRELKNLGYNISADGYFGYGTRSAVMQFQRDYSLPVTGVVNSTVVAYIKKPIKMVTAPTNLKLLTPTEISGGEIATVSWDSVAYASSYDVYVYNSEGTIINAILDTKATVASVVLSVPDVYTIKVRAKNERSVSDESTLGSKINVRAKSVVTFYNWDDTVLCRQFVEYGKAATTPAAPERDGYTFYKWDKDFSKVTENIDVKALYNRNQYNVTFLNTDGKVITTEKCYFGDSANQPSEDKINIPSGCSFIGWNKDFSKITEDITVKPVVQYANDDLPIIIENYAVEKDENFGYNITATIKNYDKARTTGRVVVALKTGDEKFVTMTESSAFTLSKSDFNSGNISSTTVEIFVPCSEEISFVDIFVVATYNDLIPISEVERYTVDEAEPSQTIKNISGFVDASLAGKQAILFIYKIGDASDYTNEFVGQTVIDDNGKYSFNYNLREEPSIKTGDYTVVLGIEGSENSIYLEKIEAPKPVYTVTFKNYDGSVLDVQHVEQGNSAAIPSENPSRAGYTFAGWDYTNSGIYEDLTITAIYAPVLYTVVFIDWTNKRYDVETYKYGEKLIAPDLNSLDDFNAIGWEGAAEGTVVKQNMVITAKYEQKKFTVKFYDYDGNIIEEKAVPYGESVEVPTLGDDSEHVFYDWDTNKFDDIKNSMDVHPYFRFVEDTATPIADIESGVYENNEVLKLTDLTDGAVIYYSVNGGEFMEYTNPIVIDSTAEISYYASSFGKNNSDCVNGYYIINKAEHNNDWKFPVSVYSKGALIGEYIFPARKTIDFDAIDISKTGYNIEGYYTDAAMTKSALSCYLNNPMNIYVNYVPVKYTVTFKDSDGDVIDTQQIDYLDSAIPPEFVDVPDGYIFLGWNSDDYYCVTENIEIKALIISEKDSANISLNRDSYTMMEGYTYNLVANVQGIGSDEIQWNTDDESIAVVDENGKVTAISYGVAVITASVPNRGIYATCYITVTENPIKSIKLVENSKYSLYNKYICGISPSENTVDAVNSQLETVGVRFFNNDKELSNQDIVSTGTVVKFYDVDGNISDEKVLVVTGDVDGDGYSGIADVSHITRFAIEKETLTGCYLLAADTNADGEVNNRDASLIMRYNVDKEKI